MARLARSALGQVVNFDLLAIKQQLAATPVTPQVAARRQFIDEKDGRNRRSTAPVDVDTESGGDDSPLSVSLAAAQASKLAAED